MGGSQVSMAMDLHIPNKGPVTLKVKDRSDTARRHQLLRQTKVEYVEEMDEATRSPTSHSYSSSLTGKLSQRKLTILNFNTRSGNNEAT